MFYFLDFYLGFIGSLIILVREMQIKQNKFQLLPFPIILKKFKKK